MKEIFVGIFLLIAGLWINENWGQTPKEWKRTIMRRSNQILSFAAFVLAPALFLAFFSAAFFSGIHAGVNDLPDDAPVTLMDGLMVLTFTIFYGLAFHWFLPRPPWNRPRQ